MTAADFAIFYSLLTDIWWQGISCWGLMKGKLYDSKCKEDNVGGVFGNMPVVYTASEVYMDL